MEQSRVMSAIEHAGNVTRFGVDLIAAGAMLGTLLGSLPPLAAGFAMIWYGIQIYESETVQNWLRRQKVLRSRRRTLKARK